MWTSLYPFGEMFEFLQGIDSTSRIKLSGENWRSQSSRGAPMFLHIKKGYESKPASTHLPSGKLSQKRWKDPPFYSWELTHYFDWAIFYVANCYIVITRPGSSSPRRFRPHQFGTWSGPPGTRSPLLLHTTCGCVQKFWHPTCFKNLVVYHAIFPIFGYILLGPILRQTHFVINPVFPNHFPIEWG